MIIFNGIIRLGGFRNLAIALKKKDPVKSQVKVSGIRLRLQIVNEYSIFVTEIFGTQTKIKPKQIPK